MRATLARLKLTQRGLAKVTRTNYFDISRMVNGHIRIPGAMRAYLELREAVADWFDLFGQVVDVTHGKGRRGGHVEPVGKPIIAKPEKEPPKKEPPKKNANDHLAPWARQLSRNTSTTNGRDTSGSAS